MTASFLIALIALLSLTVQTYSALDEQYAPHRYDRSSSQFSPSGRILQAEYALKASKRYINEEEDYFDEASVSNETATSTSVIPAKVRVRKWSLSDERSNC